MLGAKKNSIFQLTANQHFGVETQIVQNIKKATSLMIYWVTSHSLRIRQLLFPSSLS